MNRFRYVFYAMLAFCIFCNELSAQTENGTIHKVPAWFWVDYENEGIRQPWRNGITYSKIGDSCGINEGGSIEVIGQFNDEMVLCLYKTKTSGMGTSCENGTIFLMLKKELVLYNSASEAKTKAKAEKKSKIQELLKNRKHH